MKLNRDQEVADKIRDLILEAWSPRDARKEINQIFPDYNNKQKLKELISKVTEDLDKKKIKDLQKTQYFKYFLIGQDSIKAF